MRCKSYSIQFIIIQPYVMHTSSTIHSICHQHRATETLFMITFHLSFHIFRFCVREYVHVCIYVYTSSLTIICTWKFGICTFYFYIYTIRLSTEHTHFHLVSNHPDCCRENADCYTYVIK